MFQKPFFRDRADAGRQLAEALREHAGEDALVLGMARGGVPVAFEVAQALRAELDVLVARKLGAPGHPEFGFGAIALHAESIDEDTVRDLGLTPAEIDAVRERERAEMTRREAAYRGERDAPRLYDRTVIIVDDGVATGGTARAALAGVKREGASRIVFAAPVGPPDAHARLADEADEVVILQMPESFHAVGAWYERFDQTSDAEVLDLLRRGGSLGKPAPAAASPMQQHVAIRVPEGEVAGTLSLPPEPLGLVIFAHGSGSGRFSPRNQFVARALQERGLATLLMDLLTPQEEEVDEVTREHRFDIPLLARRLARAKEWAAGNAATSRLRVGYFGSSTGGGAALLAAGEHPENVGAVVSRGGRPDLAGDALPLVRAPTLLLVGGLDDVVIDLNAEAKERMTIDAELHIVPGASHLFEEPGALEEVAGLAADFFARHLRTPAARPPHEGELRHG
jgi:putative phosphoribosyl transferase